MRTVTLALAVSMLAGGAGAQTPTGRLAGTVTDPSGAVLAGARVRAISLDTGLIRETVTEVDGAFVIIALTPGAYRVTADRAGFSEVERSVGIEAGTVTAADFTLAVGPLHATVIVERSTATVQTDHHQIAGVVSRSEIEELPLNGRDYLELARLEPGVTHPIRGTNNRTFVAILGAGLQTTPRIGATRVTVDGASVGFVGGIGASLRVSPDAVHEFQLASATFDVLTGLTSNGAVNIVTRSGSNAARGSGFFFYRDDTLAAYPGLRREALNPDPSFRRGQGGAFFGGPVRPNRAFVFASYEHHDQESVVGVQPSTPEFQLLGGIFQSPYRGRQFSIRIDGQLPGNHQLFGRHTFDGNRAFAPLNDRTDFLPSAWSVLQNQVNQSVVGLTSILSSRLVGDVRASHFSLDSPERPPGAADCGACVGLGWPRTTIPDADLSLGDARTLTFVGHRYQTTATLSWQAGRHTVRGLFDWEHALTTATIESPRTAQLALWSPRQVHRIDSGIPLPASYSTESDILRLPVQNYSAAVSAPILERDWRLSRVFDLFRAAVSDTWRAAPRLTVNGGVAWSYEPNALNHDLTKPVLLEPLVGPARLGAPRVEKTRLAPAAGFAWMATSDSKTIVHGGIGRYFDPTASANAVNLKFERQSLMPFGSRLASPRVQHAQPTPQTAAHVLPIIEQLWADLGGRLDPHNRDFTYRNIDFNKTGRNLSDPLFATPYAIHANVGVQRELARNLGASANVVWRRFHRTVITDIDYNRWNSAAGPVILSCLPGQRADPMAHCSNGAITFDATAGRARYRALLIRVDKRFSNRVGWLVSYALSSFTGTNGTGAGTGFDLADWYANEGPLPADRRHVLNVSGMIALPWRFHAAWNMSAYSAAPFSVYVDGIDFNGDGTGNDLLPGTRVNQFGRAGTRTDLARLVERYNQEWAGRPLCCGQASAPPLTLPAEYIFEDSFFTQDLRITRTWRHGALQLSMFADVFNVFNTANLTQIGRNIGEPAAFGKATARGSQIFGSGGPRALQLAIRASF